MTKKRDSCLCGYEGRSDHVLVHRKKCKSASIIETLQKENAMLKTRIEYLEEKESKSKTSNVESMLKRGMRPIMPSPG